MHLNIILIMTFIYIALGMLSSYSIFSNEMLVSQIRDSIPEEVPEEFHSFFMNILMVSIIFVWPIHLFNSSAGPR